MVDFDGNGRYNDPEVPDTGGGTVDYVDMGAYERQATGDVLWRNSVSGMVYIWFMHGLTILSEGVAGPPAIASDWQIEGVGDFDGNLKSDILWRNSVSGTVYIWLMNGLTVSSEGVAVPRMTGNPSRCPRMMAVSRVW